MSTVPPSAVPLSEPRLVLPETDWRVRPARDGAQARDVALVRWRADIDGEPLEVRAREPEACHLVSLSLKRSRFQFQWARTSLAGPLPAPSLMVTGPREHDCRGIYHDGVDVFRAYLPPALLAECVRGLFAGRPAVPTGLCAAEFVQDEALTRLMLSLVNVEEQSGLLAPVFVEGVGMALAARLVALYLSRGGPPEPRRQALAPWRLEKVRDYVEAHLDRVLSLAELGAVAGLSRIRFGAQFRAAMGVTPYAYVLQRRVAFAQRLLREPAVPLAEIALLAGFGSQAHFTTVFRRQTGMSPGQWRRAAGG